MRRIRTASTACAAARRSALNVARQPEPALWTARLTPRVAASNAADASCDWSHSASSTAVVASNSRASQRGDRVRATRGAWLLHATQRVRAASRRGCAAALAARRRHGVGAPAATRKAALRVWRGCEGDTAALAAKLGTRTRRSSVGTHGSAARVTFTLHARRWQTLKIGRSIRKTSSQEKSVALDSWLRCSVVSMQVCVFVRRACFMSPQPRGARPAPPPPPPPPAGARAAHPGRAPPAPAPAPWRRWAASPLASAAAGGGGGGGGAGCAPRGGGDIKHARSANTQTAWPQAKTKAIRCSALALRSKRPISQLCRRRA